MIVSKAAEKAFLQRPGEIRNNNNILQINKDYI